MRRRLFLVHSVVAAVALVSVSACAGPPEVSVEDQVPSDVSRLAVAVWDEFRASFEHMGPCLGPVTLGVDRDLPDRGFYQPDGSRVILRIPGTEQRLRQTLLHEFAHHLDASCLAESSVRDDFRRAIGSPEVPWSDRESGSDAPAELFAEAISFALRGDQFVRTPVLPIEAVSFAETWLADAVREAN